MQETELIIEGILFPKFSSRGVRQTMTPIECGEVRRTINGELIYLGLPSHHKYKSTILCEDQSSFGMDHNWIGTQVNVHCILPLIQKSDKAGEVSLIRKARLESIRVENQFSQPVAFGPLDMDLIQIPGDEGPYTITFQPILTMRIVDFATGVQEWEGKENWTLCLEEL